MKKASLLPAVIMGCMGIAFAAISILPDTTEFPQRPGGAGTIAGLFDSFFNSDGTAKNAVTLSGSPAREYLQDNDCTNPVNNVWVGVDENGKGKCGSLVNNLLGYITDYSGTTVTIKHTWDPMNPVTITDVGIPVYDGDAIETGGDALVTVVLKDNSAIRLNTGSLVDFTYVMSGSENIAQLILDHGEIWGRVMTSTGMNFGNQDWIAGVRGTALTMDYRQVAGVWTGSIYIIDSTAPIGTAAAVVESRYDSNLKTELEVAGKMAMVEAEDLPGFYQVAGEKDFSNVSSAIAEIEDDGSEIKVEGVVRTTSLLSPWIRENIKKDLVHLANLTNSGTVAPNIKTRAKQEFFTSVPKTMLECTNTLFGKVVKHDKSGKQAIKTKRAKFVSTNTTLNAGDFCTPLINAVQSAVSDEVKINTAACALGSMKFFGGSDPDQYCEEKGLVAVAEYTYSGGMISSLGMYKSDGSNLYSTSSTLDYGSKYQPNMGGSNSTVLDATSSDYDNNNMAPFYSGRKSIKDGILLGLGYTFDSSATGWNIITHTGGMSGLYLDNLGNDTYVKYNLPININKIEVTVRGASLIRGGGTKYSFFGIHDGYELSILGSSITLDGFAGKQLTVPRPSTAFGSPNKFYTIVFQKDAIGNNGKLSVLDENGDLEGSDIGDVGINYPYLKGNQPYIYIGADGEGANAINDIIDSVRLYNE